MVLPPFPDEYEDPYYAKIAAWADAIEAAIDAIQTATGAKLDATAAPELIRDTIGTALLQGTAMSITINDAGDTITIGVGSDVMRLSTTQTVSGAKTFSGAVTVGTPTLAGHATTKDYVDGLLGLQPVMPWKAGRYYGPQSSGNGDVFSGGGMALVANRHYAIPIYVPTTKTVDRIGVYVTAEVAASTARLAIYAQTSASDPWPNTRLIDAGTVATATTGTKEITISQSLTGGQWHWLTIQPSATISVFGYKPALAPIGASGIYGSVPEGYTLYTNRADTAAPATFGAPGGLDNGIGAMIFPNILVRCA